MALCYLALLFLVLWKMEIRTGDNKKRECFSIVQAKAIQGIFVIFVMLSHFSSYVEFELSNILDKLFVQINNRVGQLMVVMFLFYSGYGIMNKIRKQPKEYLDNFWLHRFLPVYAKFFVCILLFLILNICTGEIENYSLMDIVLSFVAWRSIGNSSWFMFATFFLYIMIIVSFKTIKMDSLKKSLVSFTLFTLMYIMLFSKFLNKGEWWYNTILCFPFGMWFNFYIDKFESLMEKKYIPLVCGSSVLLLILYLIQDKVQYAYCALAIVVVFVVLLVTFKIKIGNKILDFFGRHIFSIYMLQRLTYILFGHVQMDKYLFLFVAFITTIVIAVSFDYFFALFYKRICRVVEKKI